MLRTASQNSRMFGLFSRLGIEKEDREALALQYSLGRTDRTSELTFDEARALISDLEVNRGGESKAEKEDKMRKRIISMAHEMGWELENGRADMKRIQDWTLKFG